MSFLMTVWMVLLCLSRNITFMNHRRTYCLFKNQEKLKIFEKFTGITILKAWSFLEEVFLTPDSKSTN